MVIDPHQINRQPILGRKTNVGSTPIIFPGREFIYCLEGYITYTIEDEIYPLAPGDGLVFDAYILHAWRNTALIRSCALP